MADEVESLNILVTDVATGRAEVPVGQINHFFEQTGIPPETGNRILERVRPVLIAVEQLTNETPDDQDVHSAVVYKLLEETQLAQRVNSEAVALAVSCERQWSTGPITQTLLDSSTFQEVTYVETPDMVTARLDIRHQAKNEWDAAVARTQHQDPSRVAAVRSLPILLSGTEFDERQKAVDQLVAVMGGALQQIKPGTLPEDHRDDTFYNRLAEVCWQRIKRDWVQEPSEYNLSSALSIAVGRLERDLVRLGGDAWQLYEAVGKSAYILSHPARRLDSTMQPPPEEQRAVQLVGQFGSERIQIKSGKLTIDGSGFFPSADGKSQSAIKLPLLRALMDKHPLPPDKVKEILARK